jgi:hypothetical protein
MRLCAAWTSLFFTPEKFSELADKRQVVFRESSGANNTAGSVQSAKVAEGPLVQRQHYLIVLEHVLQLVGGILPL